MTFNFLKTSLLIVMSLFLSSEMKAQVSELDSLERLVETNIPDSLKLKILYQLSDIYNNEDIDKGIFYAKKLAEFSQETDNQLYIGVAYNLLGSCYLNKNYGLDTVITALETGMKQAEKANSSRLKAVVALSLLLKKVFLITIPAFPPAFSILMKCCKNKLAVSPVLIGKFCCTSTRSLPPKGGLASTTSYRSFS